MVVLDIARIALPRVFQHQLTSPPFPLREVLVPFPEFEIHGASFRRFIYGRRVLVAKDSLRKLT